MSVTAQGTGTPRAGVGDHKHRAHCDQNTAYSDQNECRVSAHTGLCDYMVYPLNPRWAVKVGAPLSLTTFASLAFEKHDVTSIEAL